MLKPKLTQTEQGLTSLEVLAAMLVTSIFFLLSMQLQVVSSMFQVKADLKEEAHKWILQEKQAAELLAESVAVDNSRCSAATFDAGYAASLRNTLEATRPINPRTYDVDKEFDGIKSEAIISSPSLNMVRTYNSATSQAPHEVLGITYEVKQWDGSAYIGDTIAEDSIELIPDVVLQCP
jgi:hypothetical protein